MVPPERRLEYTIGNGWGPLCAFLGKNMPEVPFPRVNDRDSHFEGTEKRRKKILADSAKRLGPFVMAAVAIWLWYVWFGRFDATCHRFGLNIR